MNNRILLLFPVVAISLFAQPKPELLWPGGAPGALGDQDSDKPELTTYLPDAARKIGAAVVICPGGGYVHLSMDLEGKQPAEWLNSLGITAFVLKYRLGPRYHHPAPLADVQQAIRLVRSRAASLQLDPARFGVWGFSAGGHLASTAGTHFDAGDPQASDPIAKQSSRPDFLILAYPVISFVEYPHKGSRNALLGENADPKLAEFLSNERQVTATTPPTFLFHTANDPAVLVENSMMFFAALRKNGVPAEMHIYAEGKHGVGLAQANPVLSSWTARLADWLRVRGIIPHE